MPRFSCSLVLPILFAACGDATHAADTPAAPPKITIGPGHRATFSGGCEIFTWPIAGELRGELKATLRHFADGKETVQSVATFASSAMPIVGEIVLVVRKGEPLGSADERSVELRMPTRRDPAAVAVVGSSDFSSMQPTAAFRLPKSKLQQAGHCGGGAMLCVPQQVNQIELWSEKHCDRAVDPSHTQPWHLHQKQLLGECVDGREATVLTIEHELDAPSVPKPR